MPILEINDTPSKVEQIANAKKELKPDGTEVVVNKDNIILDETRKFKTSDDTKTSMLFNKEVPIENIIKYPRGMKWTVDYFNQIRSINDDINNPDINISPTIQKYKRINKLVLVLQSAITQDNVENIQGEAIINAGFLPNDGDAFIATIAGGRQAIFIIQEPQTRSYNLHKAYYVNFKLFAFVDTNPELYNDMLRKTMKEYVYDKDHLLDYGAPIILQQDYKGKLSLRESLDDLREYYLDKFINTSKSVISLPTKSSIYVDTMLNNFLYKIINLTEDTRTSKLQNVVLDDSSDKIFTVFDVILKRDKKLIKRAIKDIGFKYRAHSLNVIVNRNMNYLGINFFASELKEQNNDVYKIPEDIIDISLPKEKDYSDPIDLTNRKYVFSNNFYTESRGNLSIIEKLTYDYLEGNVLNIEDINKLVNEYMSWETIDQFYLIPILMVLIKDSLANSFRSI